MIPPELTAKDLESVAFVVFDFDGVFTDNRVLVGQDGRESVWCSRADGLGLQALSRTGVGCLVLSTETNPVVSARAAKLQLECVQGLGEGKGVALRKILSERHLDAKTVAFVGNDINDLDCLREVGVPICVADAYPEVMAVARFVTRRSGGYGAVREVCDLIVATRDSFG
ncbi:MAG: HAD hydrolase family protein [Acidobacteriota bacterium]|nr:HAD hydrolase family protein [Acidobacteriota bacterium]